MENNETPESKVEDSQVSNPDKTSKPIDNKRLRDEKGHFLPIHDKTCSDKKEKKPRKKKDEEGAVKIRIVKEETPLPEKEYEGRLEDAKERTATNFIKAVCAYRPRCIYIDGNPYYSKSVVDSLRESLDSEKESESMALGTLKKMNECIKTATNTIEMLDADRTKAYRSRNIWRGVAFGILAAFLSYVIGACIERFKARKVVDNSQTPIVQVEGSK